MPKIALMNWKRYFRYFASLVICAIFVLVFFSGYIISADAPGWMRVVGVEIQAACRDAGTQWMVVVCLVSYFVVFLFLERRSKVQGSGREPNVESRETEKVGRGSPLPAAVCQWVRPDSPRRRAGTDAPYPLNSIRVNS